MTNIVVLGDVHGNARALRAALARAGRGPMDRLVFLGDLLTYGHDIVEVLDLVEEAQSRHDAVLLTGNHDQMYFDLAAGDRAYFDKLPDWLKETVTFTAEHLDPTRFRTGLRWSQELVIDGALFAHANPFGYGDWSYLNHPRDWERAADALRVRALDLGVFGHTHRARWNGAEAHAEAVFTTPRTDPIVANAGSLGQPRDARAESVLLRLELGSDAATAKFEPVTYDVAAHVQALGAAGLSAATTERLAAFFVRRDGGQGDDSR